jgi:hypothetical protein
MTRTEAIASIKLAYATCADECGTKKAAVALADQCRASLLAIGCREDEIGGFSGFWNDPQMDDFVGATPAAVRDIRLWSVPVDFLVVLILPCLHRTDTNRTMQEDFS